MTYRKRQGKEMLLRVYQFALENSTILPAAATPLVEEVGEVVAEINELGSSQAHGRGRFRGGSGDRARIAKELRAALRDVERVAKVLAKNGQPALAEQLRVPRSQSYQTLLDAANGFVETVTPVAASFVARGLPPNFAAEITALTAEFDLATGRKAGGLNEQIEGTAGLRHAVIRGMNWVEELNAILQPHLRKTNATMLQVWNRARRLRAAPQGDEEEAPTQAPAPPAPATT